jgi:short-subunit dehydrogenase
MKKALILVGSSGIGLDAAKRLSARGVAVTIVGRNAAKLEEAAASLKKEGAAQVETKVLDFYDPAQVDAYAREIATRNDYYRIPWIFHPDANYLADS